MEIITEQNFKTKIAEGVVIVDFFAEWCGPCKQLAPFLEKKQKEYPDVKIYKVDTEDCQMLTNLYQVRALPTVIIFKNGKEEERVVGFSAQAIDNTIRKVVNG